MVTIPPSGDAPAASDRELRQVAASFGAEADRYDRSRPSYPAPMVEAIIEAAPGPSVLDVGVGTGIAARLFTERGCKVLGVDIDERMAEVARRHGIEVEVARFEEWEAKSRKFDVVVSAQTWHWIDPEAGAARAAEVLGAEGRLALCWNVFQPPPEIAAAFSEIARGVLPAAVPDFWARPLLQTYEPVFAGSENGVRASGAFTEPERWLYEWERPYTTAELLDQVPTAGGFNRLPSEQVERFLTATGEAIDALGGKFTMAYTTVVVTAVRTERQERLQLAQ